MRQETLPHLVFDLFWAHIVLYLSCLLIYAENNFVRPCGTLLNLFEFFGSVGGDIILHLVGPK